MINNKFITTLLLFLFSFNIASALSDTTIIKTHLTTLTRVYKYRNYKNVLQLNNSAAYITSVFKQYSDSVNTEMSSVHSAQKI